MYQYHFSIFIMVLILASVWKGAPYIFSTIIVEPQVAKG